MRLAPALVILSVPIALCANLSRDAEPARVFGVHEIVLTGAGGVANPFETDYRVTFTGPDGGQTTVLAFHDGGNIWRARLYVSRTGEWQWKSTSTDPLLDGRSGSFNAAAGNLGGKLRAHPGNQRQWAADDGRTFLNLAGTAYILFR